MNTEERKDIRFGLIKAGMYRNNATQDNGDGRYTETYSHADGTVVAVSWGPRSTPDPKTVVYAVVYDDTDDYHVISVHATRETATVEMERHIAGAKQPTYLAHTLNVEEWEVRS